MLSELDGVTGWDFDFRGHKLQGDWQAALGVTLRVPHLSGMSRAGAAKREYPASIFFQSPWWKEYHAIEDHFARLNTALTRGKPIVRAAVVHPVESYWLHWSPVEQTASAREQLDELFRNVTEWMLLGNVDFDFLCESQLPALCKASANPLKVGEMAYDAVIVPGCETLRSTTLERLEACLLYTSARVRPEPRRRIEIWQAARPAKAASGRRSQDQPEAQHAAAR